MNMHFKIWSNIFFLIPLLLSIYYQIWVHSVLILSVMIFSTLCHINHEKKWAIIDQISAIALMLFNLYLVYLSHFRQPYFFLVLFFVVVAFYFYLKQRKSNYNLNHSLWHLSSVVITVLCILAYAI